MLSDLRKRLSEMAKGFASENPEVWDILLYGSSVKGKERPNDVDIAVIAMKGNPFEISFEFKRLLEENGFSPEEVDVKGFLLEELFDENNLVGFALLVEGYSLLRGKFLHESLNASAYFLFRFSYSSLLQSEKMRFLYAYRGRNRSDGILQQTGSLELAPGVILVPVDAFYRFREFLSLWGLSYEYAPILIGEFSREVPSLE
ncbi:nucleotidyltransferase domain-containing protein [Thermococcus sp.]